MKRLFRRITNKGTKTGPEDHSPTPQNITLLQGYEWNVPSDNKHYKRLIAELPKLKAIGIDNIWLPPGCKAANPDGVGFDIYDLWDLGEFDQKGARSTKWGSKEDLMELVQVAKEHGVGLYWDAVLNHKAGADRPEKCMAVEVDNEDRRIEIGKPYEIEGWFGFDFEGRGDKYSSMKYHWEHFSGTDYNQANGETAIFKLVGENKGWSNSVDSEHGNADYMMFSDVDYRHPAVQEDVKNWGVWITKELGLKGFRLDAVQHFSQRFTKQWIENVRSQCGDDIFMVGEFWNGDRQVLLDWLKKMGHVFSLYDAPLLYNFARISTTKGGDLREVFRYSLVDAKPANAVTVVANHDTQPGQTMATKIEKFFVPLAYSLILLRAQGYPCPFYGDLYGLCEPHKTPPSCKGKLADLILARKLYAYGDQEDYWVSPQCVGFVRRGTWDRPAGLACIMSNKGTGRIKMAVGKLHAGEKWTDVLGWEKSEVEIDAKGYGLFPCARLSVSVWVKKDADGRDRFPVNFDADIYSKA